MGTRSTIRTAPLVPIESPACPGSIAPVPRLPRGPSPAPTTTGSPGGRPSSAAATAPRGSVSVVSRIGGSWSGRTPASSIASGFQSRSSMSSMPLPDAVDSSVATWPVSTASTQSLRPTQWAVPVSRSGWFSPIQRSFTSGDMACVGVPLVWCRRGPVECSLRRSACAEARESAHVSRSVTGRRSASNPTRPCMAVLIEIPTMRAGSTRDTASRSASSTPRAIASGSWTCQPGRGFSSGYSRDAVRRSTPSREKRDAFAAVVPTSRPRRMSLSGAIAPLCQRSPAGSPGSLPRGALAASVPDGPARFPRFAAKKSARHEHVRGERTSR